MLSDLKVRWLGLTIIIDLSLTLFALWAARWLRTYLPQGIYLEGLFSFAPLDEPLYFNAYVLFPLVSLVWLLVFSAHTIYSAQFSLGQYNQIQPLVIAITSAVLVFAGLAYFFLRELSRFLFLYFYILDLILLISWRKLAFRLLNQQRFQVYRPQDRVIIVGKGYLAQEVAQAIEGFAWSGLNLIGFVHDEAGALGTMQELPELIVRHQIDEVVFALPPGHHEALRQIVLELQPLPVNLRLIPDVVDLVFAGASIENFAGLPLIGLRESALNIFDRLIKRSFDIVVASSLLLLFSPVFLLLVLLMKLSLRDGGSIFFTQQRVGEGGKVFTMYKFRTMVPGAEQLEQELLLDASASLGVSKHRDDPRITRLGRFMRRSSLDELPQLLNVIIGNMSLVGPARNCPG